MSIIRLIIHELQDTIDIYLALTIMAIGLFTFLIDSKALKNKKMNKEANFARVLGITYTLAGPILYIVFKYI